MFARRPQRFSMLGAGVLSLALASGGCTTAPVSRVSQIVVSVRDQKMTVIRQDGSRSTFPVSTSKFGLGDHRNHYETPTGQLEIAQKIGGGAPVGAVFKSRVLTGEIVRPDAPGRDAIVTRILALRGLENGNRDALTRGIYIHGTPEERRIGQPASYGCIRMRSQDVVKLYDSVGVGAKVLILDPARDEPSVRQPQPGRPL